MKILISSMSVQNYQNYNRTFMLAENLIKKGNEVTLLTASPIEKWYKFGIEKISGVSVFVIPDIVNWRLRRGGLGPLNFIFRFFYLLTHKFDIYHGDGHRPSVIFPLLIAKFIYQKAFVSEWMDLFGDGGVIDERNKFEKNLIGWYDKYFETRIRTWADGIIVLSKGLLERANKINQSAEKLLLHGGADIDCIKTLPKKTARNRLKLPEDKLIIGLVGIVDREDFIDIEILLEAISALDPKTQEKLNIIVTGNSKILDPVIEKRNLKNIIVNFGWVERSDYNTFICAADIMLMPLKNNERNKNKWPNKLGDFFAAGRAVITNPVGDVVDYLQDNKVGFLIDYNVSELKGIIKQILESNHLLEEMGANARKMAEKKISWQKRTTELLDFYNKLNL